MFIYLGLFSCQRQIHTNSICIKMVKIDAGEIRMGSNSADGQWDELPVYNVTITKPFHISATEIKLDQYSLFKPEHPEAVSYQPYATGMSWHDAIAFCKWLSQKEGKNYRLHTEAEWEFACRAGGTSEFASGSNPLQHDEPNSWGVKNMRCEGKARTWDPYGTLKQDVIFVNGEIIE